MIKLVFENSGDELLFDSLLPEVVEYYVDALNQRGLNRFLVQSGFSNWDRAATRLRECHTQVAQLVYTIGKHDFGELNDLFDQHNLNELHARWAKLQQQRFDVRRLLEQTREDSVLTNLIRERLFDTLPDDGMNINGTTLCELWGTEWAELNRDINHSVHILEECFNDVKYSTTEWVEFSNPFPKSILTNNIAHLSLSFNHLGRTLYNKFLNGDNSLEFDDENTYDQLLGFVTVNLRPSQTIELSTEYCDWCARVGREPVGDNLNIGNIPDLTKRLTEYRMMLYRNRANYFRIEV